MKAVLPPLAFTGLATLVPGLGFCGQPSAAPARTEASVPITLLGEGPYHRLTLPAAIYSHAAYPDLRDLRIRNAQGDAVPYAWLREESSPRTLSQAVPIFPVPVHEAGAAAALPAFRMGADGALRLIEPLRSAATASPASSYWLIDVSQVSGQLLQARLELAPESEGVFGFTLQASDDLRHWRPVGGAQQLVRLRHNERTLEQLSVDLGGIRARFLRLRWRDAAQGAALAAVHIDSQQAVELKPQQEWSDALKPVHCGNDACDYLTPRGWPLQSLRIELAQANTLAQVQISGLLDAPPATTPAPQPPRLLPALRHPHRREPPLAAPGPQEIVLADTVLYRLSRDGQEVRSPALTLDGAVYPRLRLRTQGPISQLGSAPPTLALGVTLRTVVFLAQGQPPFRLAWQSTPPDKAAPVPPDGAAMALATLMPGGAASQALTADTAQVTLPGAPAAFAAPASAPSSAIASGNRHAVLERRLWLWAALGAGLLLLAGMAWSLFASLNKVQASSPDSASREGPQ